MAAELLLDVGVETARHRTARQAEEGRRPRSAPRCVVVDLVVVDPRQRLAVRLASSVRTAARSPPYAASAASTVCQIVIAANACPPSGQRPGGDGEPVEPVRVVSAIGT